MLCHRQTPARGDTCVLKSSCNHALDLVLLPHCRQPFRHAVAILDAPRCKRNSHHAGILARYWFWSKAFPTSSKLVPLLFGSKRNLLREWRTSMRKFGILFGVPILALAAIAVHASIFGNIRGIVHDPQHRPIQGAIVKLRRKVRIGRRPLNRTRMVNSSSMRCPWGNTGLRFRIRGLAAGTGR